MYPFNRIFLIVLDSLGIGNANDANEYGDEGTNTLKHICEKYKNIELTNLEGLGLGNLGEFNGIYTMPRTLASIAKLNEVSKGKDTITGHYEMMGLEVKKPFKTFNQLGFPQEFINEFEKQTSRSVVGNKAASGTDIIEEFGEHQIKTGDLIVYTSSDSVFQIAAHEKYIGLEQLYSYCEIARKLLMNEEWKVARVIARPFIGEKKGEFKRTENRHDYVLEPFERTVLDELADHSIETIAVGKINDIFCGKGLSRAIKTKNNKDGMLKTIELAKEQFIGLAFINLVDFDMLYGHRRDPVGYAKALEQFDDQLTELLYQLKEDDLLILTADHGNDPTYKGSDHTREQVPLLIYSKAMCNPVNLGELDSFACIGATIADNFNVKLPPIGKSILDKIK